MLTLKLMALLSRLRRDEEGAPAVEYALLVALIAVVAGAGMFLLGTGLADIFNDMGTALAAVVIDPLGGAAP